MNDDDHVGYDDEWSIVGDISVWMNSAQCEFQTTMSKKVGRGEKISITAPLFNYVFFIYSLSFY